MIGKLIILGAIVAAIVVFVPNVYKMTVGPSLETIKQRIDHTSNRDNGTITSVDNTTNQRTTNGTTPVSVYQLPPQYVDNKTYTGQVIHQAGTTCDVSVPGMAETINNQTELTHIIETGKCSYKVGQLVQVTTLHAKSNAPQPVNSPDAIQIVSYLTPTNPSGSNPTTPGNSPNSASTLGNSPNSASTLGNSPNSASAPGSPTLPPYYQVLALNAQNQGSNVILTYEDSTGKTTSVTVTLRNSDKQLFSGTFFSSQFQTEVKDVPNTPHMIDMTVVNSVYGTLHGSVYVPSNLQNATIAGILTGP